MRQTRDVGKGNPCEKARLRKGNLSSSPTLGAERTQGHRQRAATPARDNSPQATGTSRTSKPQQLWACWPVSARSPRRTRRGICNSAARAAAGPTPCATATPSAAPASMRGARGVWPEMKSRAAPTQTNPTPGHRRRNACARSSCFGAPRDTKQICARESRTRAAIPSASWSEKSRDSAGDSAPATIRVGRRRRQNGERVALRLPTRPDEIGAQTDFGRARAERIDKIRARGPPDFAALPAKQPYDRPAIRGHKIRVAISRAERRVRLQLDEMVEVDGEEAKAVSGQGARRNIVNGGAQILDIDRNKLQQRQSFSRACREIRF